MIRNIITLSAVVLGGAVLGISTTAESQPSWPITIVGVDCVNGNCYNTTWWVNQDFTFDESYGLNGTALWNANVGSRGGLRLTYANSNWPFYYQGLRDANNCFPTGLAYQIADDAEVGTWDACAQL